MKCKGENRWLMNISREYLTFRDIQDCLTDHYRKYGSKIDAAEAVRMLRVKGKASVGIGPLPDFESWNLSITNQLWEIYQDTPIDITYMIEHPDVYRTPMPEHDSYFRSGDSSIMIVFRDEALKEMQRLKFFKIIYVLQGKCRLHFEKETRILEAGDAVILAPDTLHDHQPLGDDNITLHISMKKSTFSRAFQQILAENTVLSDFFMRCLYEGSSNYLLFHSKPTVHMCEILRNLFCEELNDRPYASSIENSYISIFLSELLRTYEENYEHYEKTEAYNVKIPMILSYMKSHFMEATLSSTAIVFGYDASYFGKLIKKNTGLNFTDIINRYKVDHARQLLKHTNLPLDQVCSDSGFNERDHFCRIFRKYTGMTPSGYRKTRNDKKDS